MDNARENIDKTVGIRSESNLWSHSTRSPLRSELAHGRPFSNCIVAENESNALPAPSLSRGSDPALGRENASKGFFPRSPLRFEPVRRRSRRIEGPFLFCMVAEMRVQLSRRIIVETPSPHRLAATQDIHAASWQAEGEHAESSAAERCRWEWRDLHVSAPEAGCRPPLHL